MILQVMFDQMAFFLLGCNNSIPVLTHQYLGLFIVVRIFDIFAINLGIMMIL